MGGNRKAGVEPFGDTADPRLYVPRDAVETALGALAHCAREPSRPAVLIGPPGLGKSLVLRVATDRLAEELACVHLPYPSLDPDGICSWILRGLAPSVFSSPSFAFEAYVAHLRETGSTLMLLVDEIDAMPLDTVAWLGGLTAGAKGELRLAATSLPGPRLDQRIGLLGPACEPIPLEQPMRPKESQRYVKTRLKLCRASAATRSRLPRATVAQLHERSGGNPRELHVLATELLRE